MIVSLYNNNYDLTSFINEHPGGPTVFEQLENGDDITSMFESYHSNSSKKRLDFYLGNLDKLNENKNNNYTYDDDGFYRTVKRRVYEQYKNKSIKSNFFLKYKVLCFIYFMIRFDNEDRFNSIGLDVIYSFMSGLFMIFLVFNVLHDSSHYALAKSYKINEFISRTVQIVILWNHYLWFRHHVYAHHSFTGNEDKDPDIRNYKPFFKKKDNERLLCHVKPQEWFVIPIIGFFPGQYFGQCIQYFIFMFRNSMWGVKISKYKCQNVPEFCFYIFMLAFWLNQFYTRPLSTIVKLLTVNLFYFLCIAPNHDTNESTIINNNPETKDWGESQVRASANFGTKFGIVNDLFGGINYQIEHHLFPDICHIHYPEISKIVKETCEEFDIPYTELSWYESIKSCLVTYKRFN